VSFSSGTIDNAAGTISFIADSLSGPGPGLTGGTLLATAIFKALSPGTTSVSPINLVLLDSNFSDIAGNTAAASVSVSGVTASPEPSSFWLLLSIVFAGVVAIQKKRTCKILGAVDSGGRRHTA
jgi:hypothetical protein